MLSSKQKLYTETLYLDDFSRRGFFPLFSLICLHNTNLPSSQFVKTVNRIINSGNASKEIVKSFIVLANMAKELMDENQQPPFQQVKS